MGSPRTAAEKRAAYAAKYPLTFGDQSAERAAKLAARLRDARGVAERASALLKQSFGATKVVFFGSLAHPTRFTEWSDIDLAAWGIAPRRYYAAVAAVMDLSTEFKIDLVDAETCPPTLREAIESEGVEL